MNGNNKLGSQDIASIQAELPRYEAPRIQAMSEKDILNSFQITQSMGAWWVVPTC